MTFHPHIEGIRKYYLEAYTNDERSETAKRLIVPSDFVDLSDLEKMWKSIQRAESKRYAHTLDDDLWVHCFINAVHRASSFPPYYYKSRQERKELVQEIEKLTNHLSKLLKANELDFHLTHSNGNLFNGFSFYEDYGEKNQWYIDQEENNKLPISVLLPFLSGRLKEEISYAHTNAKSGGTIKETRFIRSLANSNIKAYGTPLHPVTVTATKAIFGREYQESDVANLLNRNIQDEGAEQAVNRLAQLSEAKYEQVRGAEADKFGIHVSTLDEAVEKKKQDITKT